MKHARRWIAGVSVIVALYTGASAGCGPIQSGHWMNTPGHVSCENNCRASTEYAESCVEVAKNSHWCKDLLKSSSPGFKGFDAGEERLGCGCWGAAPGHYGLRDPACRSGIAVTQICDDMCQSYYGGLQYRFVCR